jgi:hypothetical protein
MFFKKVLALRREHFEGNYQNNFRVLYIPASTKTSRDLIYREKRIDI